MILRKIDSQEIQAWIQGFEICNEIPEEYDMTAFD